MSFYYDIIGYNKNSGSITFRFNNNKFQIIDLDINTEFPNYQPCYNLYFDKENNIVSLPNSNGEKILYIKKKEFRKCYQYQYDKYCKRYPLDDNGKVYKYLESTYDKIFKCV